MKRCQKGKSCGASCIERSDYCYDGLSQSLAKSLGSVRDNVQGSGRSKAAVDPQQVDKLVKALNLGPSDRIRVGRDLDELKKLAEEKKKELWDKIGKKRRLGGAKAQAQEQALMVDYNALKDALQGRAKSSAQTPSVRTKGAKIKAKVFDERFVPIGSTKGSKPDFDWEGSTKGSTFGGKGAFGTVLFNGNEVIKRGEIGKNEAAIVKKVGALGIGPSLVYGELGRKKDTFGGVDIHYGRIAMTRVPGISLGKFPSPDEKVGGSTVSDIYWKTRANLHRAGIAHNDSHGANLFISNNGVGKFIDFGLGQDNVKAALSEAIGGVMHSGRIPEGALLNKATKVDYQAQSKEFNKNSGFSRDRDKMSGAVAKVSDNLSKVENYLTKDLGLSPNQAALIMTSGIRNPESFYSSGVWNRLSNDDAKKMIDILYEGV